MMKEESMYKQSNDHNQDCHAGPASISCRWNGRGRNGVADETALLSGEDINGNHSD
jgi:hypothetical protein